MHHAYCPNCLKDLINRCISEYKFVVCGICANLKQDNAVDGRPIQSESIGNIAYLLANKKSSDLMLSSAINKCKSYEQDLFKK